MRSTPEMRARIRELMTDPHDDYDRAVECVLNDFEVLEPRLDRAVTRGLEQVDRIATLEEALRAIMNRPDRWNDIDANIARAALAPEQDK